MSVSLKEFYPLFQAAVREGMEEWDRREQEWRDKWMSDPTYRAALGLPPIVCLPLMTRPTREAEKGTKYLPEVWKPNG